MIRRFFRVTYSRIREWRKARKRSPQWRYVRDRFLANHPFCSACGSRVHLQVHHVQPFHLAPEKELDEKNLIALCMGRNMCHWRIGHGEDYRYFVAGVRRLADRFLFNPLEKKEVWDEARATRQEALRKR